MVKLVVSNKIQLKRLTELMEQNLDIARGICTKSAAQPRWEQFAKELNSLGPPQRHWSKWKRVWIDLKCKAKRKSTNKIKSDYTAVGDDSNKYQTSNEIGEAVLNILQLDTCDISPDCGFDMEEDEIVLPCANTDDENNKTTILEDLVCLEDQQRGTSTPQALNDISTLLQNQISNQKDFYEKMIQIMDDVRKSIQNIEDYQKKNYYLKKEKRDNVIEIKKEK